MLRNPKDTLVSYFYFYHNRLSLGGFNGSWQDFFKMIRNNELGWGGYFDHVAEWYEFNKHRENSMVLVYEELKKDLRRGVKQLAEFLKKDVSDEVVDIITTRTTYENMVVDEKLPGVILNKLGSTGRSKYMRKGEIGDWKQHFNEEQNLFVDGRCKEKLQPLGIEFIYE